MLKGSQTERRAQKRENSKQRDGRPIKTNVLSKVTNMGWLLRRKANISTSCAQKKRGDAWEQKLHKKKRKSCAGLMRELTLTTQKVLLLVTNISIGHGEGEGKKKLP